MRKIIVILFLLFFSKAGAAVDAGLTGSLQLKGNSKSSESFLDLLKCGLAEIPKMFLRKEKIKATYSGASKVTLVQDTDTEEKFLLTFKVPSILRVATTASEKPKTEKIKSGTAGVECAKADEVIDNM